MKNLTITILIAIALTSCHHGQTPQTEAESIVEKAPAPPQVEYDRLPIKQKGDADAKVAVADPGPKEVAVELNEPPPTTKGTIAQDTAKKITKVGDIQFETADVVKTRKAIIRAVQNAGGYIAEDSQSKDEGSGTKQYNLKVRIPAKNFDFLVDTVAASADRIDSRNINIKDITTEYIDTKTQLENKKKLEQTYLGLLSRAKKMSDVLEIEDKVSEIQGDIESTRGQLNYMIKQVAYSSLDITFYTRTVLSQNDSNVGYKFISALVGGWDALQNLFFYLIGIWPVVIIVGVAYWIVRRKMKRKAAVG